MTPPVTPTRARHSDTSRGEVAELTSIPDLAAALAQLAKLLVEQAATPPEPPPQPQPMPERVLLTVEEAAKRLGIGRTLAYRLVRTGDLESVRIGKLRRVHVDAVSAYAGRLVAEGVAS